MSQFFAHADCSVSVFGIGSCVPTPTTRGPFAMGGCTALARQRLPTDSIGNAVVAFTGVLAGSEIRVFYPDATEAAGIESCAADQVLSWPAFVPGAPNNTVRVLVMSLSQKLKEFQYVARVGAQSLPIQQEPDKWWSNP